MKCIQFNKQYWFFLVAVALLLGGCNHPSVINNIQSADVIFNVASQSYDIKWQASSPGRPVTIAVAPAGHEYVIVAEAYKGNSF